MTTDHAVNRAHFTWVVSDSERVELEALGWKIAPPRFWRATSTGALLYWPPSLGEPRLPVPR